MERSKHARVCVPHACVSFQESFNTCENFHRICSKNEYYSRHTHPILLTRLISLQKFFNVSHF